MLVEGSFTVSSVYSVKRLDMTATTNDDFYIYYHYRWYNHNLGAFL